MERKEREKITTFIKIKTMKRVEKKIQIETVYSEFGYSKRTRRENLEPKNSNK